ncbi:MAG TPA: hypothetical protein VFF73_23025 [Planctomycetota bacterium]|nr:hypothetical protein [Planctomycetota bacterium]
MKRVVTFLPVLAFAAALALLLGEHAAAQRHSAGTSRQAPARVVETTTHGEVHVNEAVDPSEPGARLAAACSRLARTSSDRSELEAELLAASPSEVARARPRLEKLLRDRPELAAAAAQAFSRLHDREELFAISRALVEHAALPEVHSALVAAAANGETARREVALMALADAKDEQVPALATSALADTTSPALVRAAAAFALSLDVAHAPPEAFAAARALASTQGADAHARAEALHLMALAPATGDGELASSVLAESDAPAELALAAARLAIQSGQDRASVARALAAHKDEGGLCARAASKLGGLP